MVTHKSTSLLLLYAAYQIKWENILLKRHTRNFEYIGYDQYFLKICNIFSPGLSNHQILSIWCQKWTWRIYGRTNFQWNCLLGSWQASWNYVTTWGKSSRKLDFSGSNVKSRRWAVTSFCMQFGNRLESTCHYWGRERFLGIFSLPPRNLVDF